MELDDLKTALEGAYAPFSEYIKYLADGRLDGHITSNCRSEKTSVPGFDMSTDPNLLLHNLGVYVDQQKIKELFANRTVYVDQSTHCLQSIITFYLCSHLFNTSGSGKTRLLLDGLCHHWGFYFTCRVESASAGGSSDFTDASSIIPSYQSRGQAGDIRAKAAERTLSMLVCGRIFILMKLLECLPVDTTDTDARRRWVFLQVVPPVHRFLDIFLAVFRSLRHGDDLCMKEYFRTTLVKIKEGHLRLFQDGTLWVVLDEAQAASTMLSGLFPSISDGSFIKHSFLHEAHAYFM